MTEKTKRSAQISPDRFGIGVATVVLVAVVMLSSMVFSYVAIAEAAIWTHAPYGMHWLAPVFIDGAIITYTVGLAVFEARREDRKVIVRTRAVLWGFAVFSVAINFAHAGSGWGWVFTSFEAWFGYLIAMSAPIAALLSAEAVVQLAFKHRRDEEQAQETAEVAPAAAVDAPEDPASAGLTKEDLAKLAVLLAEPGDVTPAADADQPTQEYVDVHEVAVQMAAAASDPDEPEIYTGPLYEESERELLQRFERAHADADHVPSVVEDQPTDGEYVTDPAGHRASAEQGIATF